MVSLAGLSAVYPGELQAEGQGQQNDMRKLQLDQMQAEVAGKQALGKVFQQMVPGAQAGGPPPPPQQMPPQASPPGQPSQPAQPPQPPPQQPMGPAAGGAQAPQRGMPVGAPPGGAQAQGGPPGGASGGGAPPPGMEGRFDLKTAAAAIAKANPGIQPRVLVEALTAALPYLNAEAKQAVAEMRQQMMSENLNVRRDAVDARERIAGEREAGLDRRLGVKEEGRTADRTERGRESDQRSADKRYGIDQIYKSKEMDQQTKFDIAQLSNETKREIADQVEGGRNQRAEMSADTRRELLTMSLGSRRQLQEYMESQRNARQDKAEAGKGERQDKAEAGKDQRQSERLDFGDRWKSVQREQHEQDRTSRENIAGAKLDQRTTEFGVKREQHEQDRTSREDVARANRESREGMAQKKLDLSTAREARLSESSGARLKQQQATLEQRKKEAEARIAKGDRTGQLGELLAVAKAQHTLDMEIISSYSFNTKLKPAERDKLVKEATEHRDETVTQVRNMAKLGGGMQAPTGQPPPEALQQLKDGQVTTFENGQKWTLRNGKPEKVQ